MLLLVETGSAEQRCDVCGTRRSISWTQLRAGVEAGDPPTPLDPNIIAVPACPTCGSSEYLNRVAGAGGRPSPAALDHRRGVNALHAALVAAGRVPSTLAAYFADERVDLDAAPLPWRFEHTPLPPSRDPTQLDPTADGFAAFLAAVRD